MSDLKGLGIQDLLNKEKEIKKEARGIKKELKKRFISLFEEKLNEDQKSDLKIYISPLSDLKGLIKDLEQKCINGVSTRFTIGNSNVVDSKYIEGINFDEEGNLYIFECTFSEKIHCIIKEKYPEEDFNKAVKLLKQYVVENEV